MMTRPLAALAFFTAALSFGGCASVYYDAMERAGFEKRDILIDRVAEAREEQSEAQVVFASALDEFRSLVLIDGGDLEKKYDAMSTSLAKSERQAEDVRARIKAVDDVGKRLFREWEDELKLYESPDLRRRSETQLRTTRRDYDQLMAAMTRAADKMEPVLSIYQDQVLFLKHNLNARAISSLEVERAEIEERVETLIAEMEAAIAEADAFIASMQ